MDIKKEMINRWISDYEKPYESLLPQNLSNDILQLVLNDIELNKGEDATGSVIQSELLAYVTLILVSHVKGVTSFDVNETNLLKYMGCYAHTLHLEWMKRLEKITYFPKCALDSILEKDNYQIQFTEEGSKELSDLYADKK